MSLHCRYRWCVVSNCKSSTLKTPEKLFIKVPDKMNMRNIWLEASGRDPTKLSTKSLLYLCQDHFDLQQDMENYMQFKIMGSVANIRMKPNTVPSKFSHMPIVSPSQAAESKSANVHPISSTSYLEDEDISLKEQKADKQVQVEIKPVMHYKSIQAKLSARYRSKATQIGVKVRHRMTSPINLSTVSVGSSTHNKITTTNIPSRQIKRKLSVLFVKKSDNSGRQQAPLLNRVIEQCRFCGEFYKDCVTVSSDMTYLAGNKTTLALNDTSVQLDFYDRSLPKTVCRHCDAKLQEFCDFVKVVKAAQCTLVYDAEEKAELENGSEFEEPTAEFEETTADFEESTAEFEEIEIKTEDNDDDKEGIVDPLAVGETVFVNKTHKRKSDTDTAKPKKLKTEKKCDDYLVIAIKEEVVEKDTHEQSEVSDTETDVKTSELELARSALLFEKVNVRDIKVTDKI